MQKCRVSAPIATCNTNVCPWVEASRAEFCVKVWWSESPDLELELEWDDGLPEAIICASHIAHLRGCCVRLQICGYRESQVTARRAWRGTSRAGIAYKSDLVRIYVGSRGC